MRYESFFQGWKNNYILLYFAMFLFVLLQKYI